MTTISATRPPLYRCPRPVEDRTLTLRAIRGTAWMVGAYGAESGLRLVSNFILASLFASEVFGLLALAALVQHAISMFSDLGIGVSVVRHSDEDDRSYLNTAWTVQAIRGTMIWVAACALTWPMAALYGHAELLAIIPILSLASLIQGFQSTRVFTAQRDLDLSRITMLRLGETVLRFTITIAWAVLAPSVWAIVGGSLIAMAAHMMATHVLLRGTPNRFGWDRAAAHDLLGFGRWVFISSALTFFAVQSDKLILGKLADLSTLGVYAIALPFAKLPHEVGCLLAATVLLPALATRARESREHLRLTFEEARGIILPAALAATLAVALVGPWFFRLYKPDYHDAIWLAPTLSVCLWFAVLQAVSDRALPALGLARPLAVANGVALVTSVASCLVGYALGGLFGFALGVGMGYLAGYGVVARALGRQGLPVLWRDLRYTLGLLAGLTICFGPLRLAGGGLAPPGAPSTLAALGLSACLLAAGATALYRVRLVLATEHVSA